LTASWSASCGRFERMRRIAPCATTQYRQSLRPDVATTTISRSAFDNPEPVPGGGSISASW
jgi:hypothetical protein